MEGIILSSWDYIMGPQIERLWLLNHNPKLTLSEVSSNVLKDFNATKHNKQSDIQNNLKYQDNLKVYSVMCGQLLLGEMDIAESVQEHDSRTYILDLKILTGVVFHMKSWMYAGTNKEINNVSLCVGFIYQRHAFDFVLKNQFTLDIHLRKLAGILQNIKLPCDSSDIELTDNVLYVTLLLDSLYHNNLDQIQNYALSSIQDYSISSILSEAIASHLQTSGHTAVLGGSEYKIKQIINILSLFNSQEELCCSLSVNSWPLSSKVSALYIQGIMKSSEKDCEYLLEHAYNECVPLTIIDTDQCRVWQTYPFHADIEKSRVCFSVSEAGYFVPQLLSDLSFAEKNDIDCHTVIKNFTKQLMIKAVALVKTVTHFRDSKRILSKQELMTLFAIYTVVDLQVLLGCAEKVKPGIRCLIL